MIGLPKNIKTSIKLIIINNKTSRKMHQITNKIKKNKKLIKLIIEINLICFKDL